MKADNYFESNAIPVIEESLIDNSIKSSILETDISVVESPYNYAPPSEVMNTHFYSDDIEVKIKAQVFAGNDPLLQFQDKNIPKYDQYRTIHNAEITNKLYEEIKAEIPIEFVDNMLDYASQFEDIKDDVMTGIGYMKYDINLDGVQDYLVTACMSHDGIMFSCYLSKIYLDNADGTYKDISWGSSSLSFVGNYILSTSTNGLKDFKVLCNGNYPIITYAGDDSYTPAKC